MRPTSTFVILTALLLAAGALSWAVAAAAAQTSQPAAAAPAGNAAGVKQIALPQIAPPDLPDGPGKEAYTIQCGMCHTQRYVTMQPRFSRKVWTDEVNKMINTYKAQVPLDQVAPIVDYLVSIRGAETPAK